MPTVPATASQWENLFTTWAQAPSQAETQRCENAVKAVRNAIDASPLLNHRSYDVFAHGSFRNRVNVPRESDVDVGIVCYDTFFPSYPEGTDDSTFGNSPATYDYATFKNEVGQALVDHFGHGAVTRGNKAFDVRATSYHVEADVAPFFEHRRYAQSRNYASGVQLLPDNGSVIINWPEQHYTNGVAKNDATGRAYKGTVRIVKNLRNQMEDHGFDVVKPIPGFLIECLVWNVPNDRFAHSTWDEVIQAALLFLWSNTKEDSSCSEWGEVSELKYLFRRQKWTRAQTHAFIDAAWGYVGVR